MHVRAYLQHPSAELVGVCDKDKTHAQETAQQFGIPKAFTDVDDMLNEKLDAISVATPDNAHADIVIKAAQRGVHILVEKPLATTLEECRRMIAAAKKSRVYLMMDWHNRWNPPYH